MTDLTLTLDDIADALSAIPPDCDRETWVQMAMAIKSEFGDGGFDTWNAWSTDGSSYKEQDARDVWKSVGAGKITIGTLVAVAKQHGHKFKAGELSKEEKQRRRAERDKRKKELEQKAEADEASRNVWRERVAAASAEILPFLDDSGKADYLQTKQVRGYGLLYVPHGFVVVTHLADERMEVISGKENVTGFFSRKSAGEIDMAVTSFRYVRYGSVVVPLRDIGGKLWGFQFISDKGDKKFLKFGRKQGCYHLVARLEQLKAPQSNQRPAIAGHLLSSEPEIIAIAEGYATAATIHQATGWPVAAAFDAGNIRVVAEAFQGVYPKSDIVICGDNDPSGAGQKAAEIAAQRVKGRVAIPDFSAYSEDVAA